MKTLPINIGYSNVKSIKNEIFKSRRREVLLEKEDSSVKAMGIGKNCDLLEYNNNIYIIGEGRPKTDYIKTNNDFLLTLVLNMCARFTDTIESFKLVLSAPPLTYEISEIEFPKYFIGEYRIKHNGLEKIIIIEEVETYPETFVAYLSNNPSEYDEFDLLIFDVGGVTTNICHINKGNFKVDKNAEFFHTSRTGMYHIDTKIADFLKWKYLEYSLEVTSDTVDDYRNHGFWLNGDFETDNMVVQKEEIDKIYREHVKNCIKIVNDKNWNLKNCKVIITGGGGKVMFHVFKEKGLIPHAKLSKNPIFDTLNGLKILAE
jgi:hypothetical protein